MHFRISSEYFLLVISLPILYPRGWTPSTLKILSGHGITLAVSTGILFNNPTKADEGFSLFGMGPLFKVLVFFTTIVVIVTNPVLVVPLFILRYRSTDRSIYLILFIWWCLEYLVSPSFLSPLYPPFHLLTSCLPFLVLYIP